MAPTARTSSGAQADASRDITTVAQQLRRIIANSLALDVEAVDPDAPFVEMGASSLALVDALRAIHETFGVRPAIRQIFERYDCINLLAEYVLELAAFVPTCEAKGPAPTHSVVRHVADLPIPVPQQHLWFLARYSEGAMLAHCDTVMFQLDGPLALDALEAAIGEVAARHDALRTTFDAGDDRQQVRERLDRIPFTTVDFSAAASEMDRAVVDWLAAENARVFSLSEPLWRASVARLGGGAHLLRLRVHRLIADRAALNRLVSEVAAAYSGRADSIDAPIGLTEYFAKLEEQRSQPAYRQAAEHWRRQFTGGIPRLDLRTPLPRPPVKLYGGARLLVPIAPALQARLDHWNRTNKSTSYVTLLAAFQAWLARMSGESDVVVGVTGRQAPWLASSAPLVANTTNMLPVRMNVDAEQTFGEHVRRLQHTLLDAFDHQDYPFAAMIHDLKPPRDQSRSALFSVAIEFDAETAPPEFSGLTVARVTPAIAHAPYDLGLTVQQVDGQLQLLCDYSTELFDRDTVREWMTSFLALLEACVSATEDPIWRLPLVTAQQRHRLLVAWNAIESETGAAHGIHDVIREHASRAPSAVALVCGDRTMTYAELVPRAGDVAAWLRSHGIGAHDFVGVAIGPSFELMIALLGVLEAGAAYVPLDPGYPANRVRFMLADSSARLLITTRAQPDRL